MMKLSKQVKEDLALTIVFIGLFIMSGIYATQIIAESWYPDPCMTTEEYSAATRLQHERDQARHNDLEELSVRGY